MFSFHSLHSLYAEATLCGIGLLVFLYRFAGGRNEWLKTHGIILVSYYAVGGLVYDELEGWPLLDTTYFLTVTVTTVGYGDIVPITVAGKLVATLTALMGVCVVALLTGIVATGFTNQVSMRRNQLKAEINSALSDGVISKDERKNIEDLRQRLNISEQDALAIMSYLSREAKAIDRGRKDN